MKGMEKIKMRVAAKIEKNERLALVIYFFIAALIVLCLVRQAYNHEYFNALLCLFSLILISLPSIIERKTRVELPQALEIIVVCFVFGAEILGEIENFYYHIPIWDSLLHISTGCLAAAVGFGAIDLINKHIKRISMTPLFVVAVAFCFSMTIGVIWEFFEYGADRFLKTDMQKDTVVSEIASVSFDQTHRNISVKVQGIEKTVIYDAQGGAIAEIDGFLDIGLADTMKDLLVNMLGALLFCIYGYLYLYRRDKYKFIEHIIIKKR